MPAENVHADGPPAGQQDAASAAANDGVQNATAESGGPPPTQKIAKRLARTKERREENKGRKAGHPGRFHGDILQFLQQHVGDYLALPSKTDGGRNSALAAFWNTVHNAFWEKFSVNDARETMPLGADVDDATVIGFINEDIKSWYRRKTRDVGLKDSWNLALKNLRKPSDGPPKRKAGWQMILSTRAAEIGELLETEMSLPENEGKHSLAVRSTIARMLWEEAGEEEQQELKKAIDDEYNDAKAKQERLLDAPDSDPIVQENARRRLAEVVTPLLELVSKATGLTHLTLIGGSPPLSTTDKYRISVVHFGTTSETVPRDFYGFDRDGFRANVLNQFCKFLGATTGKPVESPGSNDTPTNIDFVGSDQSDTSEEEDVPGADKTAPASTDKDNTSKAVTPPVRPRSQVVPQAEPRALRPRVSAPAPAVQPTQVVPKKTPPPPVVHLRSTANASLKRIVDALPEGERQKEIARLNALPDMEFHWANSDATMRVLDGTLPPKQRPKPVPRGKAADPTSQSSTSLSSPLPAPSPSNDDEASAQPEDDPSSSTTPPTGLPSPPSNPGNDTPAIPPRVPVNIPEWIQEHRDRLLEASIPEELQPMWKRTILNWILFEESHDYQTPQKGFPVPARPREISLWIQNARNGDSVVNFERYNGFTKDWLTWWDKLNPQWRGRTDGKLVIGDDDAEGDWSDFFRPGKCGFILVLECIRVLCATTHVEELEYSLKDVDWVLTQVLLASDKRKDRLATDEDDDGDSQPASGTRKRRESGDKSEHTAESASSTRKRVRRR